MDTSADERRILYNQPPNPLRPEIAVTWNATRSDIEIIDLSKVFSSGNETFKAVDHVTVHIPDNEFFTLLGPSGCGKTTLLRLIAGFEQPNSGRITLGGQDLTALPPNRRPINTVFQNYALFPHMSVADNVGFGLRMLGQSRRQIKHTVTEMLALVEMESLAHRRPAQISGGQQQRVALARALAPRPRVLLLDEPLSALDLKLRKTMQSELKRLQAETGITFVFVTHDQQEALTLSDRIAVMHNGKILQIGSPQEIYTHPAERFVADFIGDSNFLTATIVHTHAESATVKLTSGAQITARLPHAMSASIGRTVTVVVRPEHAMLADQGVLQGTLEHALYFGTDTQVQIRLSDGELFTLRRQNTVGQLPLPALGTVVNIAIAEGAAQVVRH